MSNLVGEPQQWPIEKVVPYDGNSKIHDPLQITKIARSIDTFGFDQPIVVDGDGVIIKGHGRRLAALELGMKYVPVIVRDDLTEQQAMASRLADNRVAKGGDDVELLQKELAALAGTDFDLTVMGFEDNELSFLTEESLDDMDMDSLIDDLESASKEHDETVESKAAEAKSSDVPLKEAFGFAKMSVDQARLVNRFMARLEDETGAKHAEALTTFINEFMD